MTNPEKPHTIMIFFEHNTHKSQKTFYESTNHWHLCHTFFRNYAKGFFVGGRVRGVDYEEGEDS